MMRRDTSPISRRRHAPHPPSAASATTKTRYPAKSFTRKLIRVVIGDGSGTAFDRSLFDRHFFLPFQRHHLDGRVSHFGEKAVDDGAVEEDVEARARGLAEDDVRDPFAAREVDERVGHLPRLQLNYFCAEVFGEPDVLPERR